MTTKTILAGCPHIMWANFYTMFAIFPMGACSVKTRDVLPAMAIMTSIDVSCLAIIYKRFLLLGFFPRDQAGHVDEHQLLNHQLFFHLNSVDCVTRYRWASMRKIRFNCDFQ